MNIVKSENIYIPSFVISILMGIFTALFILNVSPSDSRFKVFVVLGSLISLIILSTYFLYILRKPEASIPFIICSMWIVFFEPAICDILAAFAMLAFLLNRIFASEKYISGFSFAECMLILFIILNIHNVVKTDNMAYSLRFFGISLYLVIFFFLISRLSYSYDLIQKQLNLYFIPCVINSFVLLVSYFAIVKNIDMGFLQDILIKDVRPRGFFKDANVAGPFLIPAAIYSLASLLNKKNKSNFVLVLLFLFSVIGVFATLSRAALVSLLFSIFLVLLFSINTKVFNIKKFLKIVFLPLICFSLFFIFLFYVPQSKVISRLYDTKFGVEGRIQKIERGIQTFKESPIIGTGMQLGMDKAPHDTFFILLTQTGIMGTIFFWLPIIYIGSKLIINSTNHLYANNKVILLTLGVSLLSHTIFATVIFFLHWRHFWYMAGLATAALRLTDVKISKA